MLVVVVLPVGNSPAGNGADALAPNRGGVYEAYISAQYPTSIQEAWLSSSDEHPGWPRDPEVAARQGPIPPLGLIGTISQKGVFGRLTREGTYARHQGIWVSCLVNPDLGKPHVAYAVGRSAGNAVKRNRIRRQLRQLMAQREPVLRSAWYLVGVSNAEAATSFVQVQQSLSRALEVVHTRLDHVPGVAK